jgi:transcriptional regulator with XRE-family HTH domain
MLSETVNGLRYFDMLRPENMPQQKTIGQRLKTARLEQGMSVPQLVKKIFEDHRAEIGESTVRDIERDKTPNPGFKTIEFISRGLGLDPREVIGLGMDDPPELDSGFTESQFGMLGRAYKKIRKDKRPFADELIKMLIAQMERWR